MVYPVSCTAVCYVMVIDKCITVFYYLKHPPLDTQYHIVDGNTTHILEKLNSINDIGVIFDSNLTFKDHMAQKINKAYSVLGIIKRNFIHMDKYVKPVVQPV